MLSQLQKQLVKEAEDKHGEILPIGGKAFHDQKSFTSHTDENGCSWVYFWFECKKRSSRLIRKQISCPQCRGELQFNMSNEHGHCVSCERRGL